MAPAPRLCLSSPPWGPTQPCSSTPTWASAPAPGPEPKQPLFSFLHTLPRVRLGVPGSSCAGTQRLSSLPGCAPSPSWWGQRQRPPQPISPQEQTYPPSGPERLALEVAAPQPCSLSLCWPLCFSGPWPQAVATDSRWGAQASTCGRGQARPGLRIYGGGGAYSRPHSDPSSFTCSLFEHYCYSGRHRHSSYTCICGR